MRAEIDIAGATIELGALNDAAAPWPYFIGAGVLRMAARAGQSSGFGVGESPSLDVYVQNNRRQAHGLIGTPLRAPFRIYDNADALFYEGIVSRVSLGRVMTLTIES